MKFLRTASTRRLLASLAGALVVVAAGTAIAVAASGSGPVPAKTSLAKAARRALAAGQVSGISARISFTNHLISSTDVQGSDPILTGASGRLWLSSAHRLRLELQSDNGDAQIVLNGRSFWISEPTSNTVYEGTLPPQAASKQKSAPANDAIPSVARIQSELNRLMGHVNLSGAIPGDIAGRPAYTVSVSPKHDGGLLGSAKLAWDAIRGVPLRFAIYARGSSTPVIELKATQISYGPVKASTFSVSPPAGAKVVKISMPTGKARAADAAHSARKHRRAADVSGIAAVSKKLPFALDAPKSLVGLPRRGVSLLEMSGHPAALVTYGQNLGGIAVIEQAADPSASAAPKTSADHRGLSLPTVSINGRTGQELDTALGTLVRFTRGKVAFIVVGSVPAVAAEHAARGL